jgi:methylamine dehydrogenase heavy chain
MVLRCTSLSCAVVALVFLTGHAPVRAELPAESPGKIETLEPPFDAHWVWVSDLVLERFALIDVDNGKFLGIVNGGYGPTMPVFSRQRGEMYLPSTYFSRRTRGERTDVLEVYDIAKLSPVAEILLPGRRATDANALGHTAITDDERFVAVFNWTPATSLSIADVEQRRVAGEIQIPGCSLAFAAGERRLFALCADGSALVINLDDDGNEAAKQRTEPFFDPVKDPITEKAVRHGNRWIFVSFEGFAHPIDVGGEQLRFDEPWSLLTDAEREETWRIGGLQHLAVHEKTGRLYSLMHRGGPDTHKEPGEEIWIYDLEKRQRLQRIELVSPGVTVYGFPVEVGERWIWPFSGIFPWLVDSFVPAAVTHIQVTQDDQPQLLTAAQFSGAIGVYDGLTGELTRRVKPVGWTSDLMFAPWSERR